MSGDRLFVDTNILIYLLGGDREVATILNGKEIVISFITELELLSFPKLTKPQTRIIKSLLKDCKVVNLNQEIKDLTIEIRKGYKLKLPDAIIAASASYFNSPLFTADSSLTKVELIDIIKYEI